MECEKSDGEWFIPVDIDTCDFQRTTNAFPHPMLVVKGEQMENYTYQLEVENFIGRTIKKTPRRKFFKKKNAGIRFVRLSKYLAENFPADKLLNLKYILGGRQDIFDQILVCIFMCICDYKKKSRNTLLT